MERWLKADWLVKHRLLESSGNPAAAAQTLRAPVKIPRVKACTTKGAMTDNDRDGGYV